MQLGNFIDVFLARHVSGIYDHHQVQKLYAATQHLILLMMGVCTRNMSS